MNIDNMLNKEESTLFCVLLEDLLLLCAINF